jgi:hypothetical protein
VRTLLFITVLGACGETPPPECTTTTLDATCLPQYQPTFQNVFTNTIVADCGTDKGTCHGPNGEAGISFANAATAYQSLTAHVKAGDPMCSELIVRTHDTGQDYSMPPDQPLGESERCAIYQWVLAGTPQ